MCKNYVTNSYYACCLILAKKLLQEVEVERLPDINLQNIKISIVTEAILKKIGKEEQDDLWHLISIFIRDGTVCQLTSFCLVTSMDVGVSSWPISSNVWVVVLMMSQRVGIETTSISIWQVVVSINGIRVVHWVCFPFFHTMNQFKNRNYP